MKNLRTIHRLDRLTSGLLLFGRSPKKARQMEHQIRNRQVQKQYMCRVEGDFPEWVSNIQYHIPNKWNQYQYALKSNIHHPSIGSLALCFYGLTMGINFELYRQLLTTGCQTIAQCAFQFKLCYVLHYWLNWLNDLQQETTISSIYLEILITTTNSIRNPKTAQVYIPMIR